MNISTKLALTAVFVLSGVSVTGCASAPALLTTTTDFTSEAVSASPASANSPWDVIESLTNTWNTSYSTENVSAIRNGESFLAVIQITEDGDDSVSATRYAVTIEPDDSVGWGVAQAQRGFVCVRSVDPNERTLCS